MPHHVNFEPHAVTADPRCPRVCGARSSRRVLPRSPPSGAITTGLPLWSDDLYLREAARSVGVPVFGTRALTQVLAAEQRTPDTRSADDALWLAGYVACPTTQRCCSSRPRPTGGSRVRSTALSRPAAWHSPAGRFGDLGDDREPGGRPPTGATRVLAVSRLSRRGGRVGPGDARRAAPDHHRHQAWPRQRTIADRSEHRSRPVAEPVGTPVAGGGHQRTGNRDRRGHLPGLSAESVGGPDRASGPRSLT